MKKAIQTICILGTGNVGWHLATKLSQIKSLSISIWGRDKDKCRELAASIGVKAQEHLDKSEHFDLVICAVADDAIEQVGRLSINCSIIVHTSGSAPASLLNSYKHFGVFYPLQTFKRGQEVLWSEIPICINASDAETRSALIELADHISQSIWQLTDAERKKVHVAAVCANNFVNHLLARSFDYLEQESLSSKLIKPLVKRTVEQALLSSPKKIQTGPAKRGDVDTIKSHLALLDNMPSLQVLYKQLSEDILQWHSDK